MKSSAHDVTGGMFKKLHCAGNIVRTSLGRTKVYICEIGSRFAETVTLGRDSQEADDSHGTVIEYLPWGSIKVALFPH